MFIQIWKQWTYSSYKKWGFKHITRNSKIKLKIKIFSVVFLIIFDIIFGIGIKYILDTIYFVSDLNSVMYQKEEYYAMTLDSIIVDDIKAFNNNRLGMYKGINNDNEEE